jgi:Effector-associated domain 1/Trypsin-like peptidase domain
VAPLTGPQKAQLIAALSAAYPDYLSLAFMFGTELERNLPEYAAPGPLPMVLFQVIGHAEAQGWTDQLVTGAELGNPGNPQLRQLLASGLLDHAMAVRRALAEPTGAVQDLLPQAGILGDGVGGALEHVVKIAVGFQDLVPYATRLLELASRVCCIGVVTATGVRSSGTGFLVGPDLVLTNHHVLRDAIACPDVPSGVQCIFDYHIRADSTTDFGTRVGLASKWLEAASPPSDVDTLSDPVGPPGSDQLDYALIKLAGEPGLALMPDGRRRGWLDVLAAPPAVTIGLPLLIVQHPEEHPLKLALDTDGVLGVNANHTRLTYGVNTLGGSSGSPCFTFNLELVALHHAGSRAFAVKRNEGIPIAAVAKHLRDGGHAVKLGG